MSQDTYRRAMATKGLLANAAASGTDDPPLSVEQRDEAMRQHRIEAASQLPLEELLEIVSMRFEKDQVFRAGVRNISRNKGRPDKSGRRGKLSRAQTYWEVHKQRLSGFILKDAIEIVAKYYAKSDKNVRRQYQAEASRVKKAIAARKSKTV